MAIQLLRDTVEGQGVRFQSFFQLACVVKMTLSFAHVLFSRVCCKNCTSCAVFSVLCCLCVSLVFHVVVPSFLSAKRPADKDAFVGQFPLQWLEGVF